MSVLEQTLEQTLRVTDLPAVSAHLLSDQPRAARKLLEILDALRDGSVAVELADGRSVRVGRGPMRAHLRVLDPAVFAQTLAWGDIGLAEAWMDGLWDSEDLSALLTHFVRNRDRLKRAIYGRPLALLGHRLEHFLRANTRSGARRNIEAHYDLGNDFYRLWLDDSMTYSAAVFEPTHTTLEQAQHHKYRRILQQLQVQAGQTILEIGCGWGGFAEVAATEFGCCVLGVTLSPAQLEFARQRAARGGYANRVEFSLCDYRDIRGQYDHIVSIEMIEAVGERYWPTYFKQLSALLKPGGRCMIQAITIDDALFGRYRRGTDFIQRHVFPGGMLPSPASVQAHATAAGLQITDDFGFGRDYARTLAHWRQRFDQATEQIQAQGYSQRFIRMWRFYLAYCEAGFQGGDLDVRHYRFQHRPE